MTVLSPATIAFGRWTGEPRDKWGRNTAFPYQNPFTNRCQAWVAAANPQQTENKKEILIDLVDTLGATFVLDFAKSVLLAEKYNDKKALDKLQRLNEQLFQNPPRFLDQENLAEQLIAVRQGLQTNHPKQFRKDMKTLGILDNVMRLRYVLHKLVDAGQPFGEQLCQKVVEFFGTLPNHDESLPQKPSIYGDFKEAWVSRCAVSYGQLNQLRIKTQELGEHLVQHCPPGTLEKLNHAFRRAPYAYDQLKHQKVQDIE